MPRLTDNLADLQAKFVANRSEESRESCRAMDRDHSRKLQRLSKRGVISVTDLVRHLPNLPEGLQQLGFWLIAVHKIRSAVNVLLDMLQEQQLRGDCARTIAGLTENAKVKSVFIRIGQRELSADCADLSWLSAVIEGLAYESDQSSTEILVTIFERQDLPGWLRGDAGDKLGGNALVNDRRTKLHHRARDAAIRSLSEKNIEVKFWSMFVIASMASRWQGRYPPQDSLRAALPALRRIAKQDHRLGPGFWWPMSAEAEDAIHCIEHGRWKDPDAGHRWLGNKERGARELE